MSIPEDLAQSVLRQLEVSGFTIAHLVTYLFTSESELDLLAFNALSSSLPSILDLFADHPQTARPLVKFCVETSTNIFKEQISELSGKQSGYHFGVTSISEEKINAYSVEAQALDMRTKAPELWLLLDSLCLSQSSKNYKRRKPKPGFKPKMNAGPPPTDSAGTTGLSAATTPSNSNAENLEPDILHNVVRLVEEGADLPENLIELEEEQLEALLSIKKVICLSIMMQHGNQRCNALQSIVGLFLHSCNTPESVVEFLAQVGLSVSATSINNAVTSMSDKCKERQRDMGQTLFATYAYDNLDVYLQKAVPVAEKEGTNLEHFTTGTMLPLHPETFLDGVDGLDCSDELWKLDAHNPDNKPDPITNNPNPKNQRPEVAFEDLYDIHPDPHENETLDRRGRFNAWKMRYDLIHNGPEYFHQFTRNLGHPDEVERIPLTKTTQVPLRMVDLSPSTPINNGTAIEEFMGQGGVSGSVDSKEGMKDPKNKAVIISGDLLTGQHVNSLQESRSVEATPWDRFQGKVFGPGLFHLKMACALGMHRTLIDKAKDSDENSTMAYVSILRPKETGKVQSDTPGFRRLHDVFQHSGTVMRLSAWQTEVKKDGTLPCSTLEDYAKTGPTWEAVVSMSERVTLAHVATGNIEEEMRSKPDGERDKQLENMLIRQQLFLLYEEITYAMNYGDIGRVETCLVPWILIFIGCGKHKYAAEMTKYLENVHFIYPKGLRYSP
ncbi:hypothetical protein DFP72DRAFT_799188 [Ephemerocybe angulata]|uniref:DUF6589 domain-containing protein n=1 Tax=Ephemerocybe angulata TaxID=980116 RepID=A0A8H6MCZ3_9AGAR|nr:hypothetical protein DFP72DRAFT_799192 [Tulosesus angulatus]KAF6764727.1 hypothetical protein DFP72DRAFT_799188 [Tulosesus angulatus]